MEELKNVTTPEEENVDLNALGAEMDAAAEEAVDMGDLAEFAAADTAEATEENAESAEAAEAEDESVAPKSDDYLKTFANSFSADFVLLPPKDYNFKQAKADQEARDKELERLAKQNAL